MRALPSLGVDRQATDGLHAILQIYEQEQAEPLLRRNHQYADGTEEMAENVFAVRDIFGFPMPF